MNWRVPLFKVSAAPWSELEPALKRVAESGYWAEGEEVKAFEGELRDFTKHPHLFTTNSCTSGLTIALRSLGVKAGDVVILPTMTCVATAVPVVAMGAKVLWCDVDPYTGLIDIERGLMNPTGLAPKAMIAVDWGGDLAPIGPLSEWCRRNGAALIEDAAQAIGTHADGAAFRCFSFQAIKQLTSSDGGMVLTKTGEQADLGKRLSWFGIDRQKFRTPDGEINWDADIPNLGMKANMNNVTAAIGRVNLKHLPAWLSASRANGHFYEKALADIPQVRIPKRYGESAYWVFTMTCENRDKLMARLQAKGIQAGRMHTRIDRYSGIPSVDDRRLTGTDYFASHVLCLPCGHWVTSDMARDVVNEIRAFYGHRTVAGEPKIAEVPTRPGILERLSHSLGGGQASAATQD